MNEIQNRAALAALAGAARFLGDSFSVILQDWTKLDRIGLSANSKIQVTAESMDRDQSAAGRVDGIRKEYSVR